MIAPIEDRALRDIGRAAAKDWAAMRRQVSPLMDHLHEPEAAAGEALLRAPRRIGRQAHGARAADLRRCDVSFGTRVERRAVGARRASRWRELWTG